MFLKIFMPSLTAFCWALAMAGGGVTQQTERRSGPQVEQLVLPAPDPGLQADLDLVLSSDPFRSLVRRGRLSVSLVDLSDPAVLRYGAVDDNRMRYAASLPKIAIMLTVFDRVDGGTLEYTPALRSKLEAMIRNSSNSVSSELIQLVGFENIEAVLRDPRYELYDPDRKGGLWVGKGYGGLGVWRRDPLSKLSHGATTRQVARFLVMMEQGSLVSPWASREMKAIMGNPAIEHKFVLGLRTERPLSRIFRKSGTWQQWHADAAVVERAGRKYAAVALLETQQRGVLSKLIVALDDVIFGRVGDGGLRGDTRPGDGTDPPGSGVPSGQGDGPLSQERPPVRD